MNLLNKWKIDMKSLIIGILAGALILSFIGASGNQGDIKCTSLSVVDSSGNTVIELLPKKEGGTVYTRSTSGKITTFLGTNVGYEGQLRTYNSSEKTCVFLGASDASYGFIDIFNKKGDRLMALENGFIESFNDYGKTSTYLGTSSGNNGIVRIFNVDGKENAFIGSTKDGSGIVQVRDAAGNITFEK